MTDVRRPAIPFLLLFLLAAAFLPAAGCGRNGNQAADQRAGTQVRDNGGVPYADIRIAVGKVENSTIQIIGHLKRARSSGDVGSVRQALREAEAILQGSPEGGVMTGLGNIEAAVDIRRQSGDGEPADQVLACLTNARGWYGKALQSIVAGLSETDPDRARAYAEAAMDWTARALFGIDEDGDGTARPVAGEGGIQSALRALDDA